MFIYVAPGGAAPPAYRTVGAKNGAGVGFFSTGKVSCPSGLHALGGGYFATSGVRVIASWPFNDTTWAVRGASDDGQTHTYFIYVRCHA
jgi:hypothetical protein